MKTSRNAVIGVLALALTLSACGGTRVSDQAIQAAAGVRPIAEAGLADPTTTGIAPAQNTAATTESAAAPADAAGTTAATDASAGTAPAAAGATGSKPAAGTAKATGTKAAGGTTGAPAAKPKAATGSAIAGQPAAKAAGPARKSVIKLGVVGTFSGPVGNFVKGTVTGIRVWSQAVNAAGGVNGHPVQILVGDDGGDPARFNSIAQQFVEQQGVLAMMFSTLSFAPNGNNRYLDSQRVYTFGADGGLDLPYTNQFVLSPSPAGFSYADVILGSIGNAIGAKSGVKLASFACSDFGLCDLFNKRWTDPDVTAKAGFTMVASGRPSLTQPDYTSQCLSAKQAGAEAIVLALDGAAIRRFAGDCARQNYKPRLASADLVITPDLLGDKNVEGLVAGMKMAPFTDIRIPGIKEFQAAMARYAPGQKFAGAESYGWLIGQFFAEAGKNLPDNPTRKDLEDGLYRIKNNDMKGMTYPITMTRGKPMARQLCFGTVVIKDGQFATPAGNAFQCAKGGKALANADDYGAFTGSAAPNATVQQGAAMRAALMASPTTRSSASLSSGASEPACPTARVAGVSYVLDVLQTGSAAGPGVIYGAALALLGTPLPDPLASAQGQFLGQSGSSVETFSRDAPAAVAESRSYFGAFAAFNEPANAFIDSGADGFDDAAETLGPFIQPGDRSFRELAAAMRDARAESKPCA